MYIQLWVCIIMLILTSGQPESPNITLFIYIILYYIFYITMVYCNLHCIYLCTHLAPSHGDKIIIAQVCLCGCGCTCVCVHVRVCMHAYACCTDESQNSPIICKHLMYPLVHGIHNYEDIMQTEKQRQVTPVIITEHMNE